MRQWSIVAAVFASLAIPTLASAHGDVPFTALNVIHACRNQNAGALREITTGNCANNETIVHWNITGPAGTNGTDGTNGTNGIDGVSVTSVALNPGDANCPNGGSQFTSASGITYACNGQDATGATNPDPPCFDNTNRYVDCGNGTVTDTVTGLIWLKQSDCIANATYAAANQAAAALKSGDCGGTLTDGSSAGDWRLPTKDEWSAPIARAVALGCTFSGPGTPPSLTNDAGTACLSVGPSSFAGVASDDYWSSSSRETGPNGAWVAILGNGAVVNGGKGLTLRVWPVRGGPR